MGIYNDIPKKYLLDYTALVHSCYIADSNSTPLGKLADYVAKHWRKLKRQNEDDILESFYNETTEENV